MVKNPPATAGDARAVGLIPGSGRFPGGEKGNPLQYSCLENPMNRGQESKINWETGIIYTLCMFVFSRSVMSDSFVTPWTVAHQAPLSMELPRQEYWSGLPFPTPGDLLDPGIEPASLASPTLAGGFFTTVPPGKPAYHI